MKLGLNSEAAALSGLPEMLCEFGIGDASAAGCCREGNVEVFFVPKTNGFANGFKETGLRPAERGVAISVGRDG